MSNLFFPALFLVIMKSKYMLSFREDLFSAAGCIGSRSPLDSFDLYGHGRSTNYWAGEVIYLFPLTKASPTFRRGSLHPGPFLVLNPSNFREDHF
jgi:hypothetical protein